MEPSMAAEVFEMKTPEEIKTAVRFARECGSGVELEGKQ